MKKFTFLLAVLFAMLSNLNAGTRTIYLDANIWNIDGAVFAAHVWNTGDADAADYDFTLVEGNIYKADIRDDATSVIFLRKDPNAVDPSNVWAGEWNRAQTAIPTDKDMFQVTSWNEPWGTWLTYGVAVEYDKFSIYVNDQTGWEVFDLYAWGTYEAFGGWPGVTTPSTQMIDGVNYKVYDFQVQKGGMIELNLIFHNNVGEGQEGDMRQLFTINQARDYYLTVSANGITEGVTTAVDNIATDSQVFKTFENGQLIIIRNGVKYDATGKMVK